MTTERVAAAKAVPRAVPVLVEIVRTPRVADRAPRVEGSKANDQRVGAFRTDVPKAGRIARFQATRRLKAPSVRANRAKRALGRIRDLRAKAAASLQIGARIAESGVSRPQKAPAVHFLIRQELNAPTVPPASVVRATLLSVRALKGTAPSESGVRGIGRGAHDRLGMVHSGIEARAGADRKGGAGVGIFRHQKHAPVIALRK